jgi:hypothetical protein
MSRVNCCLATFFDAQSWTAFKDFIERKQYGAEGMISRAFSGGRRLLIRF